MKIFKKYANGKKKYVNVDSMKLELKEYNEVSGILSVCHTHIEYLQ